MKYVMLLRHAKSSWGDPGMDDFDRPLNERGERDAPVIGQHLTEAGYTLEHIISSSAMRAQQTARFVANATGCSEANIQLRDELYLSSPHTQLDVVRTAPEDISSVMLVAHNPGISMCLGMLAAQEVGDLPTASLGVVSFDCSQWSDIRFGSGKLLYLDTPKRRII